MSSSVGVPVLASFFANDGEEKTILGFGSLISRYSSRRTFPELTNFRAVTIKGYRRVFQHPAGVFFTMGIADLASKRYCSLSIERAEGFSFRAVAFNIPADTTAEAFLAREEEFDFALLGLVDSSEEEGKEEVFALESTSSKRALVCTAFTDAQYIERWGQAIFDEKYAKLGLATIWGHSKDSGVLPCSAYLRHCYLASEAFSADMHNSFLDDTYLVDRTTTIRQYIADHPEVLTLPADLSPAIAGRYQG